MKNMKDLYSVTYNRPHNGTTTLWQNQVRNIATKLVWGKEEAKATVNELITKGFSIISVYNGIGKNVTSAIM